MTPIELEYMIPGARHFSLWLLPSQDDQSSLIGTIENLARRHCAPCFEPHVTVYTGIYTLSDRLGETMAGLAQQFSAISLSMKEVRVSSEFFKSVFIQFEENFKVHVLSDAVRRALRHPEEYQLEPHLSLLYKELPTEQKQEIADELTFTKPEIRFDQIVVASPGKQGWSNVESWSLYFRQKLSGPGRE